MYVAPIRQTPKWETGMANAKRKRKDGKLAQGLMDIGLPLVGGVFVAIVLQALLGNAAFSDDFSKITVSAMEPKAISKAQSLAAKCGASAPCYLELMDSRAQTSKKYFSLGLSQMHPYV